MTEDELIEKVIDHDKVVDKLTTSVDSLVIVQKDTNSKLDKLIENSSMVALLNQKVDTMDTELNASFKRVHRRADKQEREITTLVESRNEDGCQAIKTMKLEYKPEIDKLDRLEKDMEDIKAIPNKILWRFVLALTVMIAGAVGVAIGLK